MTENALIEPPVTVTFYDHETQTVEDQVWEQDRLRQYWGSLPVPSPLRVGEFIDALECFADRVDRIKDSRGGVIFDRSWTRGRASDVEIADLLERLARSAPAPLAAEAAQVAAVLRGEVAPSPEINDEDADADAEADDRNGSSLTL